MALTTVSSDRLSTNVKTSNLGTELKKKVGQNKNLIINGAMQIAQRGTSSTSTGYLIDRVEVEYTGLDEAATVAQVDVASGTGPYTSGFRKAYKITNGNQTSGAGAGDRFQTFLKLEAQDIANSGWDYTSSSSFITLSFWVKSSVAQNFFGYLRTKDGTGQRYAFETGSLTADTWTKITKTFPGNANLTFNNDNGEGLQINLQHFSGTDFTDSGVSLNAWGAYASGTRTPDQTSTWYTTNDSTLEYTGFQLEVGSVATDFEHKTFAEDLNLCQRYFIKYDVTGVQMNLNRSGGRRTANVFFPTEMRTNPTVTITTQFDDGGATISADNVDEKMLLFIQASSNASNDAPNVSVFTADAEL
tara:strand:- start:256 stop:1332 length:1077 start_codon:yes stop_codon:yes gene_type:complete